MSIIIRNMTEEEYKIFYHWSVKNHAAELMGQLRICRENAVKKATQELSGMLPGGLYTEAHHLMSVIEECSGEIAGFIWTIHEETENRKQSFLCDFAIWESKRRRGYGEKALRLAEAYALEAGCQESVLFVADRNVAARALYKKCGYQVLRQEGYGKYMVKELRTDLG